MPRLEPSLIPVVIDLERGLRELGVPFGMVGALVPELLLDAKPRHLTNDADVTVVVQTLEAYEELKERLRGYGFERTPVRHRMRHRTGGLLDILPFSDALVPQGRLELQEGLVLNMADSGQGYDRDDRWSTARWRR
jgi:predicted nucleotidyltransferase